jgi:Holliday junction resolvasome RuvABC ATP-dependent DNA helicase subunit
MIEGQSNTPRLEDLFKVNGIPSYAFVEPKKYPELLLNLRTPGRCLVVEGPSGIGKTTAVEKALSSVGLAEQITKLSARRAADLEYIQILPETSEAGTVLVDDYHKLPVEIKAALADYLKVLADAEDEKTKIIVLGINQAGDSLIEFAPDLVNRIDVIRFETEPDEKISELIGRGEQALNAKLNVFEEIVVAVNGSFYLAQMLAREVCLSAGVLEKQQNRTTTDVSFEAIIVVCK